MNFSAESVRLSSLAVATPEYQQDQMLEMLPPCWWVGWVKFRSSFSSVAAGSSQLILIFWVG